MDCAIDMIGSCGSKWANFNACATQLQILQCGRAGGRCGLGCRAVPLPEIENMEGSLILGNRQGRTFCQGNAGLLKG